MSLPVILTIRRHGNKHSNYHPSAETTGNINSKVYDEISVSSTGVGNKLV